MPIARRRHSKRLRSGSDQTTVLGSLTQKRAAEFELIVRMLLSVDTGDSI